MKTKFLPLFVSTCLAAQAQAADLCGELATQIDAELKEISLNRWSASSKSPTAVNGASPTAQSLALAVALQSAEAVGWAAVAVYQGQMRDAKCKPLGYAISRDVYGLPAAICSLSMAKSAPPAEIADVCDRAKWKALK